MRLGIVLALLFVAAGARAQTEAGDAWTDFTQRESALENLSTSDCETACKALESLARAAQHICSVAPEHCEEAKSRLASASDRVHAACPQCVVRTPPAERGEAPVVAKTEGATPVAETAPEHGGCAGCATAPGGAPLAALFGLGALLLGAGVRRRHRR
jgi:MYXO-CTERM domain-containing protein